MVKALKFILGLVIVAVVAFFALSFFSASQLGSTASSADPISNIRNAATNAVIDQTGIKEKVESYLHSNASTIASNTGLTESQVDTAIDNLDISDWSATTLPDDAVSTGTYNGNYGGTEATITTYEDPSYVTITANDQNVTLAVPSSAQSYLQYLEYL